MTPLGGGQVAQTYAFRKLAISYQDIASILWKEFFLYQSVVVGFACLLIMTHFTFSIHTFSGYFLLVLAGLCINASVILILWTMSHFPKLYTWISEKVVFPWGKKFHIIKNERGNLRKVESSGRIFHKGNQTVKKRISV